MLRTLDAIHIATALAVGDDLESIVTYDERDDRCSEADGSVDGDATLIRSGGRAVAARRPCRASEPRPDCPGSPIVTGGPTIVMTDRQSPAEGLAKLGTRDRQTP